MKIKKILGLILVSSLVVLAGCSSDKGAAPAKDSSAPKVMKVGSVNAKAHTLSQGFYKFAEIVEKETGGSIKVEVFTDGVLGDDRRTLEGLQLGSIQGTTVSTGPISAFSKSIGALDLPYLFKDKATAYKVLDGPVGQELLDSLTASKFIGLTYWENGYRHMTNNKHEVTTLEDIKGLKIRTMESPIHVEIWKSLGANATPMSWSQVYTGLEQNVIDGQENPLNSTRTGKLEEVQKYLTMTGHVYGASPFLVSKVFWDSLTDKEKAAVKKAAIEVKDYQRDLTDKSEKEILEYFKTTKLAVSELKPGEKEKMRAALQPAYEFGKKTFGEDIVNKLLEATK